MSKKNTYSVKQLYKDIATVKSDTATAVSEAVAKTTEQVAAVIRSGTTSENAFTMSFDQVEAIPFGVSGPGQGTIVVTVDSNDDAALADELANISAQAMDILRQETANGMKGVL